MYEVWFNIHGWHTTFEKVRFDCVYDMVFYLMRERPNDTCSILYNNMSLTHYVKASYDFRR